MGRQDVTRTAADRLVLVERALRTQPGVLSGAAAVCLLAASAHAWLAAPELAWVSVAAVTTAGLVAGESALLLAVAAAVVHGVVAVVVSGAAWFGAPLLHVAGFVGVTALGSGTGVLLRRYEEARRRSRDEDAVTGLLNVRAFYDGLHALRAAGQPYAILLADIAGMRNLNERYGHPIGTEAMRALGHVLRRSTKGTDLVARLGSDEVSMLRAADHAMLAAKLAGPDEIGVAAHDTDEAVEIVHPRSPVPGRLRDVRRPPSAAGMTGTTSVVVPRPAR